MHRHRAGFPVVVLRLTVRVLRDIRHDTGRRCRFLGAGNVAAVIMVDRDLAVSDPGFGPSGAFESGVSVGRFDLLVHRARIRLDLAGGCAVASGVVLLAGVRMGAGFVGVLAGRVVGGVGLGIAGLVGVPFACLRFLGGAVPVGAVPVGPIAVGPVLRRPILDRLDPESLVVVPEVAREGFRGGAWSGARG